MQFHYAYTATFSSLPSAELGLWIIEAIMKRYQMRFYLRMRDIKVRQYGYTSPARTGRTPAMMVSTRYLRPRL